MFVAPPVAGHPLVICVRTVRTRRSAGPSVDPSDPRVARLASGHSTFSSAAAEVLSYLFPSDTALFNEQKDEFRVDLAHVWRDSLPVTSRWAKSTASALPGTRCGSRVWMALIADR
jgi:hypothetical protein